MECAPEPARRSRSVPRSVARRRSWRSFANAGWRPGGSSAVSPSALAAPLPTLRIHSSRNAPARANVAVQHRGWWYYVDDADLASKRTFLQIQMLFLTRLSEATRGTQATPVLTIPVK